MRVLGVDPGLTRCGVAVIEGAPGTPLIAHHIGVIRTGADEEISSRLAQIEAALEMLVTEFEPDVIAIERVFSQQNVRSAMGTAGLTVRSGPAVMARLAASQAPGDPPAAALARQAGAPLKSTG